MNALALGVGAATLALVAALAIAAWRARREAARLRDRLARAAAELQNLQLAFSRFAPDEVIERVIARGPDGIGEEREATVLFADIVGFTALSESVEPKTLVEILNGYFERMTRVIAERRGHVSSLVGDGILASFGALAPNPWQANDAVHAALAMRDAMAAYRESLAARGLPTFSIGVGLHRGRGVAGLVGSRDLMEFTFVGRTVNVAARIQDLTRELGADVIVTESIRASLDPRFRLRALPPATVKGIADHIGIWAVEGFEGPV